MGRVGVNRLEFLLENFRKVFTCNGTRVYDTSLDMDDETKAIEPELIHTTTLKDHYTESDINHIIDTLLTIAANTHTKIKTGNKAIYVLRPDYINTFRMLNSN